MNYSREKLLNAACKLGRGLLENGGEVYRVEQAIAFFMKAYKISIIMPDFNLQLFY